MPGNRRQETSPRNNDILYQRRNLRAPEGSRQANRSTDMPGRRELEADGGGPYAALRTWMVDEQIARRGIDQPELLEAMGQVPRHLFVPAEFRQQAYEDRALPIGWGQFISQPYLSAKMVELLELLPDHRVLEIGTGSGYDAALMSQMAKDVYTIEIIEKLGNEARASLDKLGLSNVHLRIGDGYEGWPEEAPFDAILLTAAPPSIPQPLLDQLKVGGRMVVPIGQFFQDLQVITKTPDGIEKQRIEPVRLGPMVQH